MKSIQYIVIAGITYGLVELMVSSNYPVIQCLNGIGIQIRPILYHITEYVQF